MGKKAEKIRHKKQNAATGISILLEFKKQTVIQAITAILALFRGLKIGSKCSSFWINERNLLAHGKQKRFEVLRCLGKVLCHESSNGRLTLRGQVNK
jgi:hypothetical protein